MTTAKWVYVSIVLGCVMFIVALAVSAYFAPEWRTLHVFQALPYLLVIVLARRANPWGFGVGFIMACFWNALLLFRSPVGTELIHGNFTRPDIALQLFAVLGHFLLIIGCLIAFARTRPGGQQWGKFVAGGVIAVAYLLVMVWTVGPPEGVEHVKQALGL